MKNKPLLAGIAGGAVLLLVLIGWVAFSGPSDDEYADDEDEAAEEDGDSPAPASSKKKKKKKSGSPGLALLPPKFETHEIAFYTPQPGFFVLVDGEPARNDEGERVTTPCSVGIPPGDHVLGVAKQGFQESFLEVSISENRDYEFTPNFEPFEAKTGYVTSRFGNAEIGEELPLSSLNTAGKVFDPFLTPDELMILFGGEREEGKGIYFARRESRFAEFGNPEFITSTQAADLPISPSLTFDRLLLTFNSQGKARIWQAKREEVENAFGAKNTLISSEQDDETWISSQILGDGKRLYCTKERGGVAKSYVTSRKNVDQKFSGKWTKVQIPGVHPCLSHDGLRQYSFDGNKLTRSTRRAPTGIFSEPETISELKLRNFRRRPSFRQIAVSHDEQWLYYCDDPEEGGNLYCVRLSQGAGWGYVPRGKSVEQKEMASAEEVKDESTSEKPAEMTQEKPAPADPRTLPLAFVAHRTALEQQLAAWDFEAAAKLLDKAAADSGMKADADLVAGERKDLELMQAFWQDLLQGVGGLKAGDRVRLGPVLLDFVAFKDGAIEGKVKSKDFSKPLKECTPSDLIAIAERVVDKSSEAVQARIAAFLLAAPAKTTASSISQRLNKAGPEGKELSERQQQRRLRVIEREIERENIGVGLKLIDDLVASDGKSELAQKAQALRESLYTRSEWRPVGGQKWNRSTPGEFDAPLGRSTNSFLVSPREYSSFVLNLEWKVAGGAGAQGGVFFHYKQGETLRGNAFKVQLANDAGQPTPDRFSSGALFGIRAPKSNASHREGQWNTLSLRVTGDRLKTWINGTEVLDTPINDPNIGKSGYICLDGEFGGISYRRVLVYDVPPGM